MYMCLCIAHVISCRSNNDYYIYIVSTVFTAIKLYLNIQTTSNHKLLLYITHAHTCA